VEVDNMPWTLREGKVSSRQMLVEFPEGRTYGQNGKKKGIRVIKCYIIQ